MRIILIFFLMPILGYSQSLTKSEVENYVSKIDSLRDIDQLESFYYPEMSQWGGSLNGYYFNKDLVYISSRYGAETGYTSSKAYLKEGRVYKVIYREYAPEWDKFIEPEEDNPLEYFSGMTYTDTTFTLLFSNETDIAVTAKDYGLVKKDEKLTSGLVKAIDGMIAELNSQKVRSITFRDKIDGDFSYTKNWSYPLGVYVNRHGQVSCDGFCPEGAWGFRDKEGKIYEDSLEAFYALVDTTHEFHSLQSEASQYEWGSSDFMRFELDGNIYTGTSATDAGTHSMLFIEIIGGQYKAWVSFISITPTPAQIFELATGILILESDLYKEGIMKGKFDFTFDNSLDPEKPLTWKGTFYSPIEKE